MKETNPCFLYELSSRSLILIRARALLKVLCSSEQSTFNFKQLILTVMKNYEIILFLYDN